jgi:hypothetical protein
VAIGTPVGLGTNSLFNTGSTVVITLGVAVSAGDFVIVGAGGSANGVITGVTDSKGNTYAVDKTDATLRGNGIASSKIGTALAVSDTITVTFTTSASSRRHAWAASVSGLDTTTWLDKINAASGTTGAWNGGASGTLTQADEIVFANGFHATTGTSTPATNYTELYDFGDAGSTLSSVYRIVAATTSETPGGTWSASGSQWDAVTATYKGAAAGGGSPQSVAPSSLSSASSFGTVTAVPGGISTSPASLASASSFGTTTALPGGVNVPVNGLASAASFGSPGEATGPVSVPVTGLGSAGAFGTIGSPAAPTEHFDPAIHGGKHR